MNEYKALTTQRELCSSDAVQAWQETRPVRNARYRLARQKSSRTAPGHDLDATPQMSL